MMIGLQGVFIFLQNSSAAYFDILCLVIKPYSGAACAEFPKTYNADYSIRAFTSYNSHIHVIS